jgi:hypothetical protein
MNFGGIIASALGGGAQAVGQIADREMQNRDMEARDMRLEQRQIEGEKRRSLLNREEAAAAAAEKLKGEELRMKRYAESADQVDAKAKEIGTNRDVKALQLPEGQYGPQVTPEVVDSFSPGQRANYEKQGALKKTSGSGLIQDKIDAAREVGADPTLRADLKNDYKTQLGAEQMAATNDYKEREMSRKELADENRFKTTFMQAQASLQQAAAAAARAEKSGNAQTRADAQTNLNTVISTNMKLADDAEKKLMMLSPDSPQRAELEERVKLAGKLILEAQKGLGGRISGEIETRDKSKSTPAQSAAVIEDAKKAIAKNPANRDEVIRRLKAAGIDTKGI